MSGIVTDVPIVPNEMLETGDVLFRIDPTPFQTWVDSLTDPKFDEYREHLPSGAYGQAAIYGYRFHHLSLIRKVLLRMNAWMDYLFPFH